MQPDDEVIQGKKETLVAFKNRLVCVAVVQLHTWPTITKDV